MNLNNTLDKIEFGIVNGAPGYRKTLEEWVLNMQTMGHIDISEYFRGD